MHYFHPEAVDNLFGISSSLWGVLFTFLGVIATLLLGAIAIFGDQIRNYCFRPKLVFDGFKKTSQLIPAPSPYKKGEYITENHIFQRLIVRNSGRLRAKEVRVLLTYEDGNKKELENFIPIPLNWTHWNKSSRDISRDEPAYVDVIERKDDEKTYKFCWSYETGHSIEPLLMNFKPEYGNIRLEFFERDSKVGDIYLKYIGNEDVLRVVEK